MPLVWRTQLPTRKRVGEQLGEGVSEPTKTPWLDPLLQPRNLDRVGQSLRRAFDDAAAEPLPQSFEDLLRELR